MQLVRDESGKITHIRVKSKEERKELDEVTTYIAQDIGRHMKGFLLPKGSVVVDRARLDRIMRLAESAYEWWNAPQGTEYESMMLRSVGDASDAMHDDDFAPLP